MFSLVQFNRCHRCSVCASLALQTAGRVSTYRAQGNVATGQRRRKMRLRLNLGAETALPVRLLCKTECNSALF